MKGPSIMAEISIWSAAIIVMLMMFAASIGFVAAGILAGARSVKDDTNRLKDMAVQSFSTKSNKNIKPHRY
jgi:hypothetical protein